MKMLVKDNFVSENLIEAAKATWWSKNSGHWYTYGSGKQVSHGTENIPRAVWALLYELADLRVNELLGLTGPTVFPDIEHLHGSGMHQLDAGQSLGIHLDTERHPTLPWKREATALLYLDDAQGGELDLTDASFAAQKRIEPVANRLVLFSTPAQWHRVNECRSLRRSICLFFWSICNDGFSGERRAKFV